jgi:hypothetical protein
MFLLNYLDMFLTRWFFSGDIWFSLVSLISRFELTKWWRGFFFLPSRRSNWFAKYLKGSRGAILKFSVWRFFELQQVMKKSSCVCWTKFTAAVFDLGVMSSSYSDSWIERVLIQMLVLPVGIFWSFVMTWPSLYVGWIFASWIVVSLASAGFACSVQCRIR